MPRTSAFRGTFTPNKRPYVTLTPDAYVSIQGETSVIVCGECRREINLNRYITSISTEASVDSPPGSASINLSIPDNDVNNFYVDGQLVIIPMMEIEIFAKGYFTIGGFPQYYRIFWGMVSSVSKSWSNGVTSISISCKDILRWWELTNINLNPAFLSIDKSSAGNYQLFQNQFAGANPYTVIIALAKEAMGDFSLTTGSFTSFKPEDGPERRAIASYAKDVMAYWQLKFGNIWNSLVLYGTSGQAYTFAGTPATVSPVKISQQIFSQEVKNLDLTAQTNQFKIQPHEIAAFKIDISRAGEVDFFQNETQSKLSVAMTARDQAGYEFYCDTTGDIIFKPPFYNLNVLPNKPVSWIQDFEIIDDSIHDSEAEVYTHITSSGNAFGGVVDYGLNDEITTPRTGVVDWHLLRRYGWRRLDIQVEWAGNPRKLFYHLVDYIDRVNSKRHNGTVTIPMRPEIRMGFPIWFPKYDSFFYVQGISHNFSPGGQATTTLTLTAKRSKFIAPSNIGSVKASGSTEVKVGTDPRTKKPITQTQTTYTVDFPSAVGETANLTGTDESGGPVALRDPKTGKLLGYPNAVMVYRQAHDGQVLARILQATGSTKANKPQKQNKQTDVGVDFTYQRVVADTLIQLQNEQRANIITRLRAHRYESGMTNAGLYDYAHDELGSFKELSIIPADAITWGTGTDGGPDALQGAISVQDKKAREDSIKADVKAAEDDLKPLQTDFNNKNKAFKEADKAFNKYLSNKYKGNSTPKGNQYDTDDQNQKAIRDKAKSELDTAVANLDAQKKKVALAKSNQTSVRKLPSLNIMVRPVSDEFGFELVGHYRYGRGAFIDRGQVQLSDPNTSGSTVNQLHIQFAASGGLLTDNPKIGNLSPESKNFAQAFEQMQPEDYLTGASFKGGNYSNGKFDQSSVNYTSSQTYTDSINHSVTSTGSAIFAEADATKRAQTLGEMKPVMANGLDAVGFEKCACALGNANWLSVLPQSLISQVLSPTTISKEKLAPEFDTETGIATGNTVSSKEDILVASGLSFENSNPGGFFDVLNQFLAQRFSADYQENLKREQFATNGGVTPIDLSAEDTQGGFGGGSSNQLTPPNQALFDRAARGDPDAIAILQSQSSFDMSRSNQALDQFQKDTDAANQRAQQRITQIGNRGISIGGISTGTSPRFQPPAGGPSLSSVLNPKKLSPDGPDNFGFRSDHPTQT